MAKLKIAMVMPAVAVAFGAGILFPAFSYAESSCVTVDSATLSETTETSVCIGNFDDLKTALLNPNISKVVLSDNISKDGEGLIVSRTVTLDLAGFTLAVGTRSGVYTVPSNTGVQIDGEGTVFTVEDSSAEKSGAIDYLPTGTTAPRTISIGSGAKFVLNSGTVHAPFGSKNGAGTTVMFASNAEFEMNGGKLDTVEGITSTGAVAVNEKFAGDAFTMNGGEIVSSGNAVTISNSNEAFINIATGAKLTSINSIAIEITSTKASGTISGITVDKATIAGNVVLSNVTVNDTLALKKGTRALTNLTVNGVTTVSGGETIFGEGVNLNGGLVYDDASTGNAVLTIENGATVNGFNQVAHAGTASYTHPETKEKITTSYPIYGSLVINGGVFKGEFVTPSSEETENANNTRKEFVETHNAISGITQWTYADVAHAPEVNAGTFDEEIEHSNVTSGHDMFKDGNVYVVTTAPSAYLGENLFMLNGESVTIELDEVAKKYATLEFDGEELADVDGLIVTGTKNGSTNLLIEYNTLVHPMTTTVGLVVYSVDAGNNTLIEGSDDLDAVSALAAASVKDLIQSGEESNENLDLSPAVDEETGKTGNEVLKDALKDGEQLSAYLDALDRAEDTWTEAEGYEDILAALDENEKVAMIYDVTLGLYSNDDLKGLFNNTGDKEISFELEIPEEYLEAPAGYIREFAAVRYHNGQVEKLNSTRKGNVLVVKSNEFSTYGVTYTDTAQESADGNDEQGNQSSDQPGAPETGTISTQGSSVVVASFVAAVFVGMTVTAMGLTVVARHYKK